MPRTLPDTGPDETGRLVTVLPRQGSPVRRLASAVLRSPVGSLADALAGPHGLDRYLELVDPLLARDVDRAVVTAVRAETPEMTTLELHPARWAGHRAGQYVPVTVEVDGRRRTRTYSISSSQHRGDGRFTITVRADPDGLVSPHLARRLRPGDVVELGAAAGEFVLPERRPERLLLVAGGSGITPVMSLLRTLVDEGAATRVVFLYWARTRADVPFAAELEALGRRAGVEVLTVLTREPAEGQRLVGHLTREHLQAALGGELDGVPAYACGPTGLVDAITEVYDQPGLRELLHVERFRLTPVAAPDEHVAGSLRFADSHVEVAATAATILEQAEAAGLAPAHGCRMGVCHTCVRPKLAGRVRDVRDGRVSSPDPEPVQLCVSVPVGDVTVGL